MSPELVPAGSEVLGHLLRCHAVSVLEVEPDRALVPAEEVEPEPAEAQFGSHPLGLRQEHAGPTLSAPRGVDLDVIETGQPVGAGFRGLGPAPDRPR